MLSTKPVGVLAGGRQPLVDAMPCAWNCCTVFCTRCCRSRLHHRLGRLDLDERGERRGDLARRARWRAWLSLARRALARSTAATPRRCRTRRGSRRPTRRSSSGSTSSCTGCDGDGEVGRLLGALGRGGERQLVAGGGAEQLVVEVVGDPALADLVRPVLGVEPGDRLAVAGGGEVERDVVAAADRAVDVGELAVAARARPATASLDLVVGRPSGDGSSTRRPP